MHLLPIIGLRGNFLQKKTTTPNRNHAQNFSNLA